MDRAVGVQAGVGFLQVTGGALALAIDPSVYSLRALLSTCYWFTDRCYILITRGPQGGYVVHIEAKQAGNDLRSIGGEFANALLDHELRRQVETETRNVRELLVAKAFAEGDLLEELPPGTTADPIESGASWTEMMEAGLPATEPASEGR